MISHLSAINPCLRRNSHLICRLYSSTGIRSTVNETDLGKILNDLNDGKLTPSESETIIRRQFEATLSSASKSESLSSPDAILKSFADIDHTRSSRTGFPEAVFGAGKTPNQISMILDDMARHFNENVAERDGLIDGCERAILATRVSPEAFDSVKQNPLSHGHLEYHSAANIVSMIPTHSTGSVTACEKSSVDYNTADWNEIDTASPVFRASN